MFIPILYAFSQPLYHICSNFSQHIGIDSSTAVCNSLPKVTKISDFNSIQLYSRGNSPRYPLEMRLGGPQNRSGRRRAEKILGHTGTRTPTPRPSSLSESKRKCLWLRQFHKYNSVLKRFVPFCLWHPGWRKRPEWVCYVENWSCTPLKGRPMIWLYRLWGISLGSKLPHD
jgi:hypothetical protein